MIPIRLNLPRVPASFLKFLPVIALYIALGAEFVHAQQEVGFVEKFATATDRREVLSELIPGTDEYFYYHCLHYQNEGKLPEAQAILDAWRAKFGDTGNAARMLERQKLLDYSVNPQQTLTHLKNVLGLKLDHAPPARDRAATLPDKFDNSLLNVERLVETSLASDRSLRQFRTNALGLLINRKLSVEQLRALIARLDRADLPGVVEKIAEELALKDSRGFGWAAIHSRLTLEQLETLQRLRPELPENDAFVRAIAARLAPAEGTSLSEKTELRTYLGRLLAWSRTLPPSQSSFKALVLGNLLRLDLSEGKYERELFSEYLQLPRPAPYYEPKRLAERTVGVVQLEYAMNPQVPLTAMGDDSPLVRRFLEHFLRTDERMEDFSPYLKREFLETVLAETRILYGLGDEATWYSKLTPGEQKDVRERIELRFAPQNQLSFHAAEAVHLDIELKNVDQLMVKIYEINLINYYRNHDEPLNTAIDLDGLIPNHQRQISYSLPAQRRHAERIELPELAGRGTWVVDLLGGGQRSRALIQKGRLLAQERLGDAGHVLQIVDEMGQPVTSAHIELNGREFKANEQGEIVLPYAEQAVTRHLLLVDGIFATQSLFKHSSESYQLQAGFLIDRQSLIAGKQATVVIRTRLTCNGRPISIRLLDKARLSIVATDLDGTATSQTIEQLDLADADEFVHTFLVPQRLANLTMSLSGQVANQSRHTPEKVAVSHAIQCNGIQLSHQVADFFLRESTDGFQLLVLGRNGEPIPRLPIEIAFSLNQFTDARSFTLATNASGIVELGPLNDVMQFSVSAADIQATSFAVSRFHRDWPGVIQIGKNETITLPLGKELTDRSHFSLYEVRRDVPLEMLSKNLTLERGSLKISELPQGNYVLQDHEIGQRVLVVVGDALRNHDFVSGKHRLLQASANASIVIRDAKIENGNLVIEVDNADAMTRVHVVANALAPETSSSRQLQLARPPLMQQRISPMHNHFVDSLKLDDEYSYILERQGAKKYPGNMLPQPSLLVHPWEVSVTENSRMDPTAGDPMPKMMAPSAAAPDMQAEAEPNAVGSRPDWKSFDFLDLGAVVQANLELVDGRVSIPLERLAGCCSLTVIAIHPTAMDSRRVPQVVGDVRTRDQRLRSSFDAQLHLAQVQRVEHLAAGETKTLGDPRTRRLQVYATIADVFQLYSTLLANPEWEKFRFVGQWHELSEKEQLARYNEMACHELNFFLYHKDRAFFDRVVRPLIAQKLDKQLMDLWLLGQSLEGFDSLWRSQRCNALERILLADRIPSRRLGTLRWFNETVEAHPTPANTRQMRFEVALLGAALSSASNGYVLDAVNAPPASGLAFGGGGYGGDLKGMLGKQTEAAPDNSLRRRALQRGRAQLGLEMADKPQASMDFFGVERLERRLSEDGFFQSLDKTREWAETHYHQVRLSAQSAQLIPINAFWHEFLDNQARPFLPQHLEFPCSTISEALCALAVIDLPIKRSQQSLSVKDEQLEIRSETAAVVFLESIEENRGLAEKSSILVGQEVYLAQPQTADESIPLGNSTLLTGVPYRISVVVTNPSSRKQSVQVLTQLPTGSVPLSASRLTRSVSLDLEPYSTAQVETSFYFPQIGEFEHYGAQVSSSGSHLAATPATSYRVAAEPESVDETNWSYIADWATDVQVLEALKERNLERLDLSRIAFRLQDRDFYSKVIELLKSNGRFDSSIWAYAVAHNDRDEIAQLLHSRPDYVASLGVALDSSLIKVDPQEQMSYEHLDYKPLVVARMHRLGRHQTILNPSLHQQYHALLEVIAHQSRPTNDQRLQLCYYMLLQNRIEEALVWFDGIERTSLATELQYDYFDAYLDFYRGRYDRAGEIAARYADYPVVRWAELFGQIGLQVSERERLLAGLTTESVAIENVENAHQRLLTDGRQQQMTAQSRSLPVLDFEVADGRAILRHRNLRQVQVNYFLMDIELLFSRNPFVSQAGDQVPAIQPNFSQTLDIDASEGSLAIKVPEELHNRNLLIEVTASGISRSSLLTASSLTVDVTEPVGRLQVFHRANRSPVAEAYVKVFAKNSDGTIRFYKDGYTDLNGRFDYATLSTSDLDGVQRLAILILHPQLGAIVREVQPPTR